MLAGIGMAKEEYSRGMQLKKIVGPGTWIILLSIYIQFK
jgi:hypothetical protein